MRYYVESKTSIWNQIVANSMRKRKNIGTIFLMCGMFFCPIGFDAATAVVMKLTGSYWITMFIFYLLSALFFGAYFYFCDVNVLKHLKIRFKLFKKFFGKTF